MIIEAIEAIKQNGWGIITGLMLVSVFIQITPIKINPLTWLGKHATLTIRWIGKQLNSELYDKIHETQLQLDEHLKQADERFEKEETKRDLERISRIRWEILDFGYSIKTNTYRREAFDHIFEQYEDYKKLLTKHSKQNGQTDRAMKQINDIYNKRMNDPDF